MSLAQDLARLALQEERLQFHDFDANTAWNIGARLRALAEARSLPVAIDIQVNGHALFFAALPGATPDNSEWVRRKRNVVQRFRRSSYAVGLKLQSEGKTLAANYGIEEHDYAPHGGCFPIKLHGTGCIGTITVSGLPQREDHELIVEVLAEFLEVPLQEVALEVPPS
ncbi:MAG: heme-degrading domain-containing protein [candidate division KSB1 bacterium]